MTTPDRKIPTVGPLSEYHLLDILRNQQERADASDKVLFPLANGNQGVAVIMYDAFVEPLLDDSDEDPENWVYGPPTYTLTATDLQSLLIYTVLAPTGAVLLFDASVYDASAHTSAHYIAQYVGSENPLLVNCVASPNPFYLRPTGFCEIVAVTGAFGLINAFDAAYDPQIHATTAASFSVDDTNFKQIISAGTGCDDVVIEETTLPQTGSTIRVTNMKATGTVVVSAGTGVAVNIPTALTGTLDPYESAVLRNYGVDVWVMETGPAA